MRKDEAKVISLVPSWTETLIQGGVNVVGRTRFCIHPSDKISDIKVVGGTKTYEIEKILELNPDYVVLDKEENKKELADALSAKGIRLLVSHVTSIESAINFLNQASIELGEINLKNMADRYRIILNKRADLKFNHFCEEILIEKDQKEIDYFKSQIKNPLLYLIWKNPYMCVGRGTFIWQQFELFGLSLSSTADRREFVSEAAAKYPQIEDKEVENNYCLLSSEPYPFEKSLAELRSQNIKCILVDGEKLSWYGIRNLSFLENCLR